MSSAGDARRGRIELLLLRSHSENERSDCHHCSIHGAGLGADLRGRAPTAKALGAESRCRGSCHRRHRTNHRNCRSEVFITPPSGLLRLGRGPACVVFLRVLQRWRASRPGVPRPLARSRLDSGFRRSLLAVRESSVEDRGCALRALAVGISVRLLHDFGAGIVLSTSSACNISSQRVPSSPAAWSRCSRSCWQPRCWEKGCARCKRWGLCWCCRRS